MSIHLNPHTPTNQTQNLPETPFKNTARYGISCTSEILSGAPAPQAQSFCSKAVSTTWFVVSYPFVKLYEWTSRLLCCCFKGAKIFTPERDILSEILGKDAKEVLKKLAKEPQALTTALLENCLADPEKMEKALSTDKVKTAGKSFSQKSRPVDEVTKGKMKIDADFLVEHPGALKRAILSGSEQIVKALGTEDKEELNFLRNLFGEFLPALADAFEKNPADFKNAIRSLLKVDHNQPASFAKPFDAIDKAQFGEKWTKVQDLADKCNGPISLLASLQCDLDLEETSKLIGAGELRTIIKDGSLEDIFINAFLAGLNPEEIDAIMNQATNVKPTEAAFFETLKKHQGTTNRQDAVRVCRQFRTLFKV